MYENGEGADYMAKLLKAEILTVKQIIDKIEKGEWKFDTTTQRGFIYNSPLIKKVNPGCGNITKAGYVIYNIVNKGIILPPITIWHNTETGDWNIHDGKQRSLSCFYFYTCREIVTYVNGKAVSNFNSLSAEDQDKILNYRFVVQYNEGTIDEEKENFYEVNSNAINLTEYENLRSVSYGEYIYSFEDYINGLRLDYVKEIGRGEQAYKLLLALYDLNDSKQAGSADISRKKLRDLIAPKIHTTFDEKDGDFDLLVKTFNELSRIKFAGASKGLSEDIALAIARYVVRNYPARVDDVIQLYSESAKLKNDILSWSNDFNNNNLQTHKCFVNAYLNDGLKLDPKRYFDDSQKDEVIKRDGQRCAHVDQATGERCCETAYNKLEMDHVVPWSRGGKTEIGNAQLLCKSHNASKGGR